MTLEKAETVYLNHFKKDNALSENILLSIFAQSGFKPVMIDYANQYIELAASKVEDEDIKKSILDLKSSNF